VRVFILPILTVACFGATTSFPHVLAFEARQSEYVSRGASYTLSIAADAAVLKIGGRTITMSAAAANSKPSLQGLDRMPGRAHYILSSLRASYDLYRRVRWHGVYPGIDLVFRGNQEHLEYDLEIAAGRHPQSIALAFETADDLQIDSEGGLVLRAGAITIRQPRPVAYQIVAGRRQPVAASFWLDESRHVRFRTGPYDRRRALVIDPEIVFDQTFGGSAQSIAQGFARDAQGNLYVTGMTNSPDFATANPAQAHLATAPLLVAANAGQTWRSVAIGGANQVNAIASAPSSPSTLYAATVLGVFRSPDGGNTWTAPSNNGLTGAPISLAVDANSSATLYAATSQGLFVSTDGAANWQAASNGITGTGVASLASSPSQAGVVYVGIQNQPALFRSADYGQTWTKIPTPADRMVPILAILFGQPGTIILGTVSGLEISSDNGATWTAGANQQIYNREALAISPGNPDILYLVNLISGLQRSTDGGQTFSPVLPSVQFSVGAQVAIDPRNSSTVYAADYNLLYRSTDGGARWSQLPLPYPVSPQSIFVSPADSRLFLATSTHFDVFVTKWSADGSQVLYSTFLGGTVSDSASAIAVDASGSAYITGFTQSPDFPTTSGAYQTRFSGQLEMFVARLSADGSKLLYSTLVGPARPSGIAVDRSGDAVITGSAQAGFPVTPNAFQSAPVAGCDVQIPFEITVPSGDAFVTTISPAGDALVYSTLFGANCATYGQGIALDAAGNTWIVGSTVSTNLPVTSDALQSKTGGGYYDGFLARFNPSGGLDYASYLGGSGYDSLNAIAFDPSGNLFLAGESGGLSQPASPGAFQPKASASCPFFSIGPAVYSAEGNAVVLKLDPAAHNILRLTYLGAPSCLLPNSIAVDSAGQPWIAGSFPGVSTLQTVSPVQFTGPGFLSKFSADFTQLLFSTYFDPIAGFAPDNSGFAYIAGTGSYQNVTNTQPAYLAKIDSTPTTITVDSIASAVASAGPATFPGVAPGEVLRILGRNLGPTTPVAGSIVSGVLSAAVAGVQVTFDGVPAPLLFAGAQEIDLMTPFELAGKTATSIQVQYHGSQSNTVRTAVNAQDVQILGLLNDDLSANTASNPARAGSIVTLYLAGVGPTDPPSQDGQINAPPLPAPSLPIQIAWAINNPNGMTILPITFAGAAPGLAAGIFQINFVAPQQTVAPTNLFISGNFGALFNLYIQ